MDWREETKEKIKRRKITRKANLLLISIVFGRRREQETKRKRKMRKKKMHLASDINCVPSNLWPCPQIALISHL